MKHLYTLLLVLLFSTFAAHAQQVIYEQNFNTTTALPAEFASTSATWIATGGELRTNNPNINDRYSNKLIKNGTQVGGYVSVIIQWDGFRSKLSTGNDIPQYPVTLTYTTNLSSQVQTAVLTGGNNFNTQQTIANYTEITLPEGATSINFSINLDVNAKKGDYYAIDNFKIIGNYPVAPLPVELMFFKGAVQGANTILTWATAQESNNDKFIVERSQDGSSFSAIGEVKGNGNSSTRINYTFTDTNPAEGANYYRLRQVDLGGTEEISNLVALQFKGLKHALNGNIAKVYPTIAAGEVTVSLALSNAQVTVLDANGQQIAQYSDASYAVVVPTAHLHPGIYFVKVSDGSQQQTQRFIKQ